MSTDIKVYVEGEFAYGYQIRDEESLINFFKGSPEFVEVAKDVKIPASGDSYSKDLGFTYLNELERHVSAITQESTTIAFIENGIVNRTLILVHGAGINDTLIAALLSNPTFVVTES